MDQNVECSACDSRPQESIPYDELSPVMNPISRDELLSKLRKLQEEPMGDGHGDADQALLDYINDPEILEAFLAVGRYYD